MTELMQDVDVCIGVEPLQLLDDEGKEIKDSLPEKPGPNDYKEIMTGLCMNGLILNRCDDFQKSVVCQSSLFESTSFRRKRFLSII